MFHTQVTGIYCFCNCIFLEVKLIRKQNHLKWNTNKTNTALVDVHQRSF